MANVQIDQIRDLIPLNDKNKMYLEGAKYESKLDDSKYFLSCTNNAILTEYSIF